MYVFGFSFSDVDEPQILEICKDLYKDCKNANEITWYLNTYGDTMHGDEDRPANEDATDAIKKIVSQIDGIMGTPCFGSWL